MGTDSAVPRPVPKGSIRARQKGQAYGMEVLQLPRASEKCWERSALQVTRNSYLGRRAGLEQPLGVTRKDASHNLVPLGEEARTLRRRPQDLGIQGGAG